MQETTTISNKAIITKTQVECYKIRYEKQDYWADITIDSGDNSGRLSISSDYGNWAYYWGSCGKSFKEFLISLNIHYCAGKFGCDRYFDSEATIKLYKRQILQERRIDCISQEEAREMFNEIKELDDCDDESYFIHKMFESHKLMRYYDGCPDIVKIISPSFKRFWDKPWKDFVDQLKKEIEL